MFSTPKPKFEMRGQFTPENCALVLVDYQVGTLQLIRSSSSDVSLRNAVMLATAATKHQDAHRDDFESGGSHPRANLARTPEGRAGRIQEPRQESRHRECLGRSEL